MFKILVVLPLYIILFFILHEIVSDDMTAKKLYTGVIVGQLNNVVCS